VIATPAQDVGVDYIRPTIRHSQRLHHLSRVSKSLRGPRMPVFAVCI
jgi:hypothetical protein